MGNNFHIHQDACPSFQPPQTESIVINAPKKLAEIQLIDTGGKILY
jgi:hypothetical protein